MSNNPILILVRHGESEYNRAKKFTGWQDVGLTEKGKSDAELAGTAIKNAGFSFDIIFMSKLRRANDTAKLIQKTTGLQKIPAVVSWKLNERHYGDLEGKSKEEITTTHGKDKVHEWRRTLHGKPPEMAHHDPRHPKNSPAYPREIHHELPNSESIKEASDRVIPYFLSQILPQLEKGKKVLVSAHEHSIRSIIRHLENTPDEKFIGIEVETATPIIYEFEAGIKPKRKMTLRPGMKKNKWEKIKQVAK